MAPITLRIPCDEHVDPELRKALDTEHKTEHVLAVDELGAGTDDDVIWEYAVEHRYFVLTNDRDFIDGTVQRIEEHPGVLRYRGQPTIGDVLRVIRAIDTYLSTEEIAGVEFRVPDEWI
ncbi:MAG: DUF5615 family PIN-like protein [Euryarchaeota archaeon]|nr:DUF5615 family PIN-like protein [Euryarchaeota archaeon]